MGLPKNFHSGKVYKGINLWLLLSCGHAYPYYLTLKQAEGYGAKIRKGAKSVPVVYWNVVYRHKESGEKLSEAEARKLPKGIVDRKAFLKYYNVFNIEDIEGVKWVMPESGEKYPFQTGGFYRIYWKVVEEFGVYAVEVREMRGVGLG
ncbi:DUF1738 domain-containing protein [Echinicola soli]|uniref:DUF1738 domain-containing protein n=1 Tax=Echinicola soli TaxID=2591634 RepID=A0A514CIV3_9BACT|nr:ArdC family protein [Echinicola soli]QDH79757.1 DUF1738 domain-containing protein [Echinicola soli]